MTGTKYSLLESIDTPDDLRRLSPAKLPALAQELRDADDVVIDRPLLQGGDDKQQHVGAVRTRLMNLIGLHHKVFAQNRNRDGGPNSVQVVEGALKATLLGQDTDDPGAAIFVVCLSSTSALALTRAG